VDRRATTQAVLPRAADVVQTEGAAEEACRLLEVEYQLLPPVFDPERAMQPDAPILHEKSVASATTSMSIFTASSAV
jgi:CO/xanthine dehydrogenase Mo-binding subunit